MIARGVGFDVRGIDFAWIATALRTRVTEANRSALAAVLWAHDEAGMDMLCADELQAEDFRQFGSVFDEVTSHVRSNHSGSGLLGFLEAVQSAIQSDPRWANRALQ